MCVCALETGSINNDRLLFKSEVLCCFRPKECYIITKGTARNIPKVFRTRQDLNNNYGPLVLISNKVVARGDTDGI